MTLSARIHIGPWKTGSTTLQNLCSSNREYLRTIGVLYPEGQLLCEAHHEIPYLLNGWHDRIRAMKNEFNLTLEELFDNYIDVMKKNRYTTIWLSSEDFATLDFDDYLRFVSYLRTRDFSDIKFITFTFNPENRIESYISQFVRQGEYVDEISRKELKASIAALSLKLNSLASELARSNIAIESADYDQARLNNNLVPIFLKNMGLNVVDIELLVKTEIKDGQKNKSLNFEELTLLNDFNRVNVDDRKLDGSCPVVFSDKYPSERARLNEFNKAITKLTELRKTIQDLQTENDMLKFEKNNLERDLNQIQKSRIWRCTRFYRALRNK